jgi:iron complex outermembrane receptor protein
MKHLLVSVLLTFSSSVVFAQLKVGGVVKDAETLEPLAGVNILIKGTVQGTITNLKGEFFIEAKGAYPVTVIFSFVGFKTQEIVLDSENTSVVVSLLPGALLGEEVVVTASRLEESILKSPVAIEKLDLRAMRETPAPSFYDALENVKGVQMITSSITFKVPNTRGFNIPNNFRFVQLVDGVDMQAATLGVPLGNAIGPTELDIESIEITPGAASALYGMNAINGMANLTTRSSFLYQGLSVYHKTGVNHVDGTDRDPSVLTETALRYARAFNNRWAFKVNVSYLHATDWVSNTRTDQNSNNLNTANPGFTELNGASNNPAYDGWNSYGNESNNAVNVTNVMYQGQPRTFIVRRTGYWEKDLVQPDVENIKADVALHYRVSKNAELSYAYRFGEMDGIFQRGNKIQLNNVIVQNHRVELKGAEYFVRGYVSLENTGDSYNLKPLADNLQLTHRSNNAWRDVFKTALQTEINNGTELAEAMRRARTVADQGRVEPGTPEFDALKNTIIKINNWDHVNAGIVGAPATGGAWLKQRSHTYHLDAQWDFTSRVKVVNLLVGADVRIYEVIPDGNNFVDFSRPIEDRTKPGGDNVYYSKYGVFSQVTKTFLQERLKISGSLRMDHNLEFTPRFNPRIAAVYTVAEKHNFRISFQNGFRFPALFEALSFVNNGNVRRVGGLPYINKGLNYLDNSYTLTSVNAFNAAVRTSVAGGMSEQDAALANRDVLQATNLSTTRPERINSFEVGYKSALLDNTLIVDIDAYTNRYDGFLGQVEVAVPYLPSNSNPNVPGEQVDVGSDDAVISMLQANRNARQVRYRVFTNAKNTYTNYGAAIGLTWSFYRKFTLAGNFNYNAITENKKTDIFLTAFNTPEWVTNISFGNRELTKQFGFNVVWRWQQSFVWESPLANGKVPAYQTLDAQVTYRLPALHSTIKVGGSNIFNNRFIQYAAGPTIGGLYYISVTVDGLLQK